jgi:cysteine desulfurase
MLAKAAIYLDSNAGAPLKLAVVEALQSFLFQAPPVFIPNPSSIHSHGQKAKRILAEARESVARSLGAKTDPEQLVFTSSGSEANQLAIRSALGPQLDRGEKVHWITTPVEHDSIGQMVSWVESRGGRVSTIPVDSTGVPCVEQVAPLLSSETALLSVLWVNNETGAITDIEKISVWAAEQKVPLHIDAAQAWGKLPIDLAKLRASWLTLSGHKIGALAGTGVLWVGRGVPVQASILGKHEKGRRGGTENLIGIISLGAAAREINPEAWDARVRPIRDRLERSICERIEGTCVNSQAASRVANTLNLSFEGVEGDGLVMALDLAGYSVSSGSACSSGVLEPSHVLMALGRTPKQAMAAVRVSLADELPWEVLTGFVDALERTVGRVRKSKGGLFREITQ